MSCFFNCKSVFAYFERTAISKDDIQSIYNNYTFIFFCFKNCVILLGDTFFLGANVAAFLIILKSYCCRLSKHFLELKLSPCLSFLRSQCFRLSKFSEEPMLSPTCKQKQRYQSCVFIILEDRSVFYEECLTDNK